MKKNLEIEFDEELASMTIEYFDIKTKTIVSVCGGIKESSFAYLNHKKDYKYHIEQTFLLTKDLCLFLHFFSNKKPEKEWLDGLLKVKRQELIEEFSKSE